MQISNKIRFSHTNIVLDINQQIMNLPYAIHLRIAAILLGLKLVQGIIHRMTSTSRKLYKNFWKIISLLCEINFENNIFEI